MKIIYKIRETAGVFFWT